MADDLVERYSMSVPGPFDREPPGLEPDPDGDWVLYSDYSALRAQLAEARADLKRANEMINAVVDDYREARKKHFEEAAQIAEKRYEVWNAGDGFTDGEGLPAVSCDVSACENIAAAIRQRGDGE
ncbi:hypothetical protein [Shinella sp. BYT-45]|uniref:hypothetical protein n=1 Tax=Shinella sp. BYT-45 TaxID=3377377 RepID=UPI003980FCE3